MDSSRIFQNTTITPLLKKSGLDINELKNFRPVSNLSFLSKILEKVVHSWMVAHLKTTDTMPELSLHTVIITAQTALLKVFSDINIAIDSGQVTALCLLEKTFGFTGRTIEWLRTFLENRSFLVFFCERILITSGAQVRCPSGIRPGLSVVHYLYNRATGRC